MDLRVLVGGVMGSEVVRVRSGWFGAEDVPWDEVARRDGAMLELRTGRRVRLVDPAVADCALTPPGPTGVVEEDIAALQAYIAGDWSPLRAAQTLLSAASLARVSDIHLEATLDGVVVRFRRVGDLVPVGVLPRAAGIRLIAALKHLAGCLPYRSDLVQEGHLPRAGVAADVRASFLPTATGERAALRLFGQLLALDALGLPELEYTRFTTALGHREGLIVVAGPSGAGKTTTLYAALGWLARHRGGAHLSLEDPVEQRLRVAGIPVDQVELRPERGLTAEVALVGALRQDVDVIAVGEVRTSPEAVLAVQAAHTGRLVLAGLHAGSAAEAHQRLLDLGVERTVLSATLRAVLHQRLGVVPCEPCAGTSCVCHGVGRRRVPRVEVLP